MRWKEKFIGCRWLPLLRGGMHIFQVLNVQNEYIGVLLSSGLYLMIIWKKKL